MFGSQLFAGRFGAVPFSGFNPDYVIATGDRLTVRMWGAFTFEATQVVDAHGNVFIPNVGPIAVRGACAMPTSTAKSRRRSSASSAPTWASRRSRQRNRSRSTSPGSSRRRNCTRLSSDSILYYLDRAAASTRTAAATSRSTCCAAASRSPLSTSTASCSRVASSRCSCRSDAFVAQPRRHTVQVGGEVQNPYVFEYKSPRSAAPNCSASRGPSRAPLTSASCPDRPGPDAPSTTRSPMPSGSPSRMATFVTLTSDKYPGTILVRVEGAQLGQQALVLPFGSQLSDALARIKPAPQANIEAVQLFRQSIAARQGADRGLAAQPSRPTRSRRARQPTGKRNCASANRD